jgi:putative DNA primase/helicase
MVNQHEVINQFSNFIFNNGETPPSIINPNGILHRFKDATGKLNCWYTLHIDRRAAGTVGNWKTGLKVNWKAEGNYPKLTDLQLLDFQIEKHRQELILKSEEKARHQEAMAKASYIWNRATPATTYSYLIKKGIQAHCSRLYKDALVIPIYNKNLLVSLQFIDKYGNKKMLSGGQLKGSSCNIGKYQSGNPVLIAEGFATGASLSESTGYLTVIAFSAGNIKQAAVDTRSFYPTDDIIICGDNDASGVGQTAAREAALAIGGKYIIPESVGCDFNDVLNKEVIV